MSQSVRSGQVPVRKTMPIADLQCAVQAWPRSCRRLGASSDVPSGTSGLITANTSAGTRKATTAPTIACSMRIARSAHRRRPSGYGR